MPAGAELFSKSRKPTAEERDANPKLREVVERFAQWKDKRGKRRLAPVTTGADGSPRLWVESGTNFAQYQDGERTVRTVPTGARTETGTLSVLTDLEKQAEKVRRGIITPAESHAAEFQRLRIGEHFASYCDRYTAKGLNAVRIRNTQRRFERIARECGFGRLANLDANAIERWLASRTTEGMLPGNRNEYRQELVGFDADQPPVVLNAADEKNPRVRRCRSTASRRTAKRRPRRMQRTAWLHQLLHQLAVRVGKPG